MRKQILILLFLPFLVTGCLRSLEKEGITNTTVYKGRVIDNSNKPLSGIMVRITNGRLIHNSSSTNIEGMFEVIVDATKIDAEYYIQIGEEGSFVKRSSLKGFGLDIYDYGDIPFENINLPEVETLELTDMTPHSFVCKCNVLSQGASEITERGVCWSTNIPTIDDHREKSGTGEGVYSCTVSSNTFDFNTTIYYARAYAINKYGEAYGDIIEINSTKLAEFMALKMPSVETIELSDMTPHSFTCKCNVLSQGASEITERGVCWSTNIPTIDDHREKSGTGEGVYSCTVSSNTFDFNTTIYYARAYAINKYGAAYGDIIEMNSTKLAEFMALKLPTVETLDITNMTQKSFTIKCNVKSKGEAIVTERGLCWATSIPTIEDNKVPSGSGEGEYSCIVADESIDYATTTYYARAYAINEYGVSYGEPIEINSSRMGYFSLPTMNYGGYTYHIHPDLGRMTWNSANESCENLVAYGYEDWYLPDLEEMHAIAEKTNKLDNDVWYWTSTEYNNNYAHYCFLQTASEVTVEHVNNEAYILHTIPVRKNK